MTRPSKISKKRRKNEIFHHFLSMYQTIRLPQRHKLDTVRKSMGHIPNEHLLTRYRCIRSRFWCPRQLAAWMSSKIWQKAKKIVIDLLEESSFGHQIIRDRSKPTKLFVNRPSHIIARQRDKP
jgi:hypothetical protein